MKTIDAAMTAHLSETVTSLTTLWKITRVDGEIFRFTDHDNDIIYQGFTYVAKFGYQRTAAANNDTLAVSNIDLEGIFDPDALDEAELRAGLFDYADVEIVYINWLDVSQNTIKVRKGKIGEVVWTPQGIFRSELRGLAQNLSQNLLKIYQPECRADLGDSTCKIPILPPILQRNQEVNAGINPEFYRVATGANADIVHGDLVTNPSFETDALAADVTSVTGWVVTVGEWSIRDNVNGLTAQDGTKWLEGGSISACEIRQDVDLLALTSIDPNNIDNEDCTASFSIYRANAFADDTGRVIVQALDQFDSVLNTIYDTGDEEISPVGSWSQRSFTDQQLPALTRKIRIILQGDLGGGSVINSGFDNVDLLVTEKGGQTQGVYENRVYEVTIGGTTASAQPTYDTGIGNDTIDGTATLTARDSFTRHCTIQDVTDQRTFKIFVVENRAVDDWFNFGGFHFESGLNAGITIEIKDYASINETTGTITLFISPPFQITPGTVGYVFAGCDKTLSVCNGKFGNSINYQGEPYIPGRDAVTQTPDIAGRPV